MLYFALRDVFISFFNFIKYINYKLLKLLLFYFLKKLIFLSLKLKRDLKEKLYIIISTNYKVI